MLVGGPLSDRKGVNLPHTDLPISPLTEKDREDLAFGLDLGVDWVALSFVQRPADVIEAQGLINGRAGVMAKIEKPAALGRIDDIIALVDAVMVARGDLGVEIPPEDVPGTQKELVRACRMAGKPVIIATQMLESMIKSPSPTRAEASDVATAIYDSADAVMLSAEFGIRRLAGGSRRHDGPHHLPHREPQALSLDHRGPAAEPRAHDRPCGRRGRRRGRRQHRCRGHRRLHRQRHDRAARRPQAAARARSSASRRSLASRGGWRFCGARTASASKEISSYDEMIEPPANHALTDGFAEPENRLVVVAGIPFGRSGSTNNIRVMRV